MRGMLSFHILWLLSQRPMHGEEISLEIEKRRGSKPKAGTIYPALKKLKARGLIKGKRNGKIIVYALTPKGKQMFKTAKEYFCHAFHEIFEQRE